MELLDGKALSQKILERLAPVAAHLARFKPCVAFIRIGENPSSIAYLAKKQAVAQSLGIRVQSYVFKAQTPQKELLKLIEQLNADTQVHGILLQAPLPKTYNTQMAFNALRTEKDIDGFSAVNLGKLCQGDPSGFVPCTPLGILELLKHHQIKLQGRHTIVLGRSLIVGRPAALLCLAANATVSICHSHTQKLPALLRQGDILIVALGQANFLKAEHVQAGATVVDVGINRTEDGHIVGDVDFENVANVADFLTPVPGGIGPMTVAMLMANTLKACEQLKHAHT